VIRRASTWDFLGALSGAVAMGLYLVYIALIDPSNGATNPGPSASADTLAQLMITNRDDARTAVYFGLGSAFLLVWFLGYLRRQLARAEGEDGWFAGVAYGAGLVVVGLMLLSVSFTLAEGELSSYGADTQVAKTLFVYSWNAASIQAPPLAALVAATMLLGFRYAAVPRWLTWLSVPIVAVMLIGGVAVPGLVTFVGYTWIAVAAIALCIQAWRGTPGPVRPAMAPAHQCDD
jgi:hypothetical protein